MDEKDLRTFHGLLENHDYITAIYSAGKAFQETLNSTVADREFLWEGKGLSLLTLKKLGVEELLSLIKPYPTMVESIKNKDSGWTKPDGWPEEWPWPDPMWVDPRGEQFDSEGRSRLFRESTPPHLAISKESTPESTPPHLYSLS